MRCILSEDYGRCRGVARSINLAYRNVNSDTFMLGKVVRSSAIISDLVEKGMHLVHNLVEIPTFKKATIIIPTHGLPKSIIEQADRLSCTVVDCTCPRVRRVQRIVCTATRQGIDVIIVGDANSPQVKGLIGWADKDITVIRDMEDAVHTIPMKVFSAEGVCMVATTEYSREEYRRIYSYCCTILPRLFFHDTLCNEKENMEGSAFHLIQESAADAVAIVGDNTSSANMALYTIAVSLCDHTSLVGSFAKIDLETLCDRGNVCIFVNHSVSTEEIDFGIEYLQTYCASKNIPFELVREQDRR